MSATLPRSMRAFPVSRPGPKDLQWVLRCSVGLGPGADAAGSASAAQWVCEGDGVGCQEPAAGSEHLGSRDGLAATVSVLSTKVVGLVAMSCGS